MSIFKYKRLFPFLGVFVLLVMAMPAQATVIIAQQTVAPDYVFSPMYMSHYYSFANLPTENGNVHASVSGDIEGVQFYFGDPNYGGSSPYAGDPALLDVTTYDNASGLSCSQTVSVIGTALQEYTVNYAPSDCSGSVYVPVTSGDQIYMHVVAYQAGYAGLAWGETNSNMAGDTSTSGGSYMWFQVAGSGGFPPAGDNCINGDAGTCIDTVTPVGDAPPWPNAEATSTTFAFGATGYVPESGLSSSSVLTISVHNNAQQANLSAVAIFSTYDSPLYTKTYTVPITSAGAFSFSTTTDIEDIGQYSLTAAISDPNPTFWGSIYNWINTALLQQATANQAISTTTQFLVATSTVYDNLADAVTAQAEALAGTGEYTSANCEPLSGSFSVDDCTAYLFIPDDASINQAYTNFQNGFLSRAPWGYVTRFMVVMSTTTASTSLPNLTISTPSEVNGIPFPVPDETLSINIFSNLVGTTSMLGTATDTNDRTFRQVVEPYWDWAWAIIGAVAILALLIHH